ncbi:MAG: hypothetical protein QOK43_1249 [Acidimicrobiaceae bacterium]|jgi:hypothetical protein|nr:hypothetical protein [Acidimicrobiaceae bacterium]
MEEATYFEAVRTRRLEVVDDDGVVRALLYCGDECEDSVYFEMLTPKRTSSLVVYAASFGVGAQVWGRGDAVASASTLLDGTCQVEVNDPDTGAVVFQAGTERRKG